METKFHKYFPDGSLEFRISDLISVRQKINEPVVNYLRRFREIRNRCYSVTLPDAQLADLAFRGLLSQLYDRLKGQEFSNLAHLQHRASNQEIRAAENKDLRERIGKRHVNLTEDSDVIAESSEGEVNIAEWTQGDKKPLVCS